MPDVLADNAVLWGSLALTSVVVFVVSLVAGPWILARIPDDYFAHPERPESGWAAMHPAWRWLLRIAKNVAGGLLFIAGVVMLFVPGQGLLTMFAGLMLLDFPRKYRVQKRVIGWGPVLRGVNWLRRRQGRAPLRVRTSGKGPTRLAT